jgi:hypothetical protein
MLNKTRRREKAGVVKKESPLFGVELENGLLLSPFKGGKAKASCLIRFA